MRNWRLRQKREVRSSLRTGSPEPAQTKRGEVKRGEVKDGKDRSSDAVQEGSMSKTGEVFVMRKASACKRSDEGGIDIGA